MSNELVEALQKVQKWHQHQVDQLKMVTEQHTDASIVLGDVTLEPETDLHKGFRMGVMVALNQLGELPFSIQATKSDDEQ